MANIIHPQPRDTSKIQHLEIEINIVQKEIDGLNCTINRLESIKKQFHTKLQEENKKHIAWYDDSRLHQTTGT